MASALPELESFLEGLSEPHILFDSDYRIVAANAAYRRAFGSETSVVGRTCFAVSHHFDQPCDQAGESCPLARARASGQRERVLHLHHTRRGDEYVNIELIPVRDAQGSLTHFIEKMEPHISAHAHATAEGLVGRAPAFRQMLDLVARVGPSTASVLLLGESGTGKELVAHALHDASARAGAPLVVVDCASLTESLFESELFGHLRGAFTGANVAKAGLVEAADGGTLFLDEVGDIPLTMQVKLLRLLESGTYRRVGSTELKRADLRIVSATHRDLAAMVAEGRFRADLYYRLSTFPIRLPALRERGEDIPLLAESLLARVATGRDVTLSSAAAEVLRRCAFPGNIRELRNVLERAALLCDGPVVQPSHVAGALSAGAPSALLGESGTFAQGTLCDEPGQPGIGAAVPTLREAQQAALEAHLARHTGNRADLAQALGISRRSLYRKLRALRERSP